MLYYIQVEHKRAALLASTCSGYQVEWRDLTPGRAASHVCQQELDMVLIGPLELSLSKSLKAVSL